MLVEALVRWTEIKLKKEDQEEAFLKRIVDGDETAGAGMVQPEFYYEFSPLTFDMADVSKFNRGAEANYTTVRFVDGDAFTIKVPYLDFQELYSQFTGKIVHSILPEDYQDPFNQENNEGDLEI